MIHIDSKKGITKISGMSLDIMSEVTFACVKLMEAMQDSGADRNSIIDMFEGIKKSALELLDNPELIYDTENEKMM